MQQNNRSWKGPRKQREHKLNDEIRFPEVRITGENITSEVVSSQEALDTARNLGLDLILIAPNANPPVCKIEDYGKFMYNRKKHESENKQVKTQTKELRLTPTTGDSDFEFKVRHAINWLEQGDRILASVFFRGREIVFKDQGQMMLLKLAQALSEHGKIESMPRLEGKRMYMSISPKPKKDNNKKKEEA